MRWLERYLKNEQSVKRLRRFCSRRPAVWSLYILFAAVLISTFGEFVANSKPLMMGWNGKTFFPVLFDYHPSDFGIENQYVMDYRAQRDQADWSVWPLIEWSANDSNSAVDRYPSPPSSENLLGTDDRGRDVLVRLIFGFRNSFRFAFLVWFMGTVLGVFVGALMGYLGGLSDLIGQRLVEIFDTLPFLIILIMLGSIFSLGLTALIFVVAIFQWMMISTYIRAEVLKLRKREFVEAARAAGASHLRIIFLHILPNGLSPVITFAPFLIAANVSVLAGLDYLGFGLQPPSASWGELLRQAQSHITHAWWLVLYPALAIIISILLLNLIGEAVRDAFDPKR